MARLFRLLRGISDEVIRGVPRSSHVNDPDAIIRDLRNLLDKEQGLPEQLVHADCQLPGLGLRRRS